MFTSTAEMAATDYFSRTSWAVFFILFIVTAIYATRRRWEPLLRTNLPLYNRLFPAETNMLGRAGAGYLPGNATTGALPRSHLLPIDSRSSAPSSTRLSASSSNATFQSDLESGLSSEMFDLNENASDSRGGLAEDSKLEIQNIMREQHIGFDEARAMYTARVLEQNNIDADGLPRDPRAVFFS
ncbi:uncharacterized protein V2V93DRAFT_372432 [Kockiozyma suomiensis]|uniref:uncharacterized protein n=1 Tax=Kockiozyma suomiensis TaxID=1337062 RepID=UPI003343FB50